MKLNNDQIRQLKALAHHLDPVVMIGQNGLTPNVLKEINVALSSHELIKVRVLGDDREIRQSLVEPIVEGSKSVLVQHIGKLLVLYRKNEEASKIKLS